MIKPVAQLIEYLFQSCFTISWQRQMTQISNHISFFKLHLIILCLTLDRKQNFLIFRISRPPKSSRNYDKLWLESLNAVTTSTRKRQTQLEESLENVSKVIYFEFDKRRSDEMTSLNENKKIYRQKNAITKRLWQYQKRFLTSERGAWNSRFVILPYST